MLIKQNPDKNKKNKTNCFSNAKLRYINWKTVTMLD